MLIRHNEDDLDKVFRQKLYNAEEEAPLHLWEGIRQTNTKKRRVFIWWWMLPVALLVGGALVYALQQKPQIQPVVAQNLNEKKKDVSNESNSSSIKTIDKDDTSLKDESTTQQDNSAPSATENKEVTAMDKKVNALTKPANTSVKSSQAKSKSVESTYNLGKQKTYTGLSSQTTLAISNKDDVHKSDVFPDILSLQVNDELNIDSTRANENIASYEMKQALEAEIFSGGGLPYVESSKESKPPRLSVGVYYLLSQPVRMQRPNANDDSFKAFTGRTKPLLSHGFGLMTSYSLPWNVQLSAGIEYQRFDEKHSWTDSTIVQHKTYIFDYDTITAPDYTIVTQNIADSVIVTEQLIATPRERVNHYSFVQIPVMLSWNYPMGKYSIGLELGTVFKISSVYTGNFVFADWVNFPTETDIWNQAGTVSTTSQLRSVELATAQVYRNWQTDLHIGIHQSYMINTKLAASLSLQTRIMMNDARTSGEIAHRFIQPGVRVGLNYFIR